MEIKRFFYRKDLLKTVLNYQSIDELEFKELITLENVRLLVQIAKNHRNISYNQNEFFQLFWKKLYETNFLESLLRQDYDCLCLFLHVLKYNSSRLDINLIKNAPELPLFFQSKNRDIRRKAFQIAIKLYENNSNNINIAIATGLLNYFLHVSANENLETWWLERSSSHLTEFVDNNCNKGSIDLLTLQLSVKLLISVLKKNSDSIEPILEFIGCI
jgi:hypothetical protein